MIAIERTTGNPYSGDPSYDALQGTLVGEYTVKRVDRRRNCTVWTTYEVIDLGRREPITPRDPDEQMASEKLPRQASPYHTNGYYDAIAANRAQRFEEWGEKLIPYLQEHGPTLLGELLTVADSRDRNGMNGYLICNPEIYFQYKKSPRAWGLHGQTYTPTWQPTRSALRIRDILIERGPMLPNELNEIMNTTVSFAGQVLHKHRDDLFVVVGQKLVAGIMRPIWGVVGIHAEQDAA